MKFHWFTILVILPLFPLAQLRIKGKVFDAQTKMPLEGISIILSNTTSGTVTDKKGEFHLENLKIGKYDLVATAVNFEEYLEPILINESNESLIIYLKPAYKTLKEVVVEPSDENGWEKWGGIFKSSFIGSPQQAKNCVLINPEVVKFRLNDKTNKLKVFSTDKLIFENKALGYRIIYLLTQFEFDFSSNSFSFKGHPLFELLIPRNAKELAKWNRMRSITYNGSLRQFIRSLYFNQLEEDGFELRKSWYVSPEEIHRVKHILVNLHDMEKRGLHDPNKENKDSMDYYMRVRALQMDEDKIVLNGLTPRDSVLLSTNEINTRILYFKDYLQVSYSKKRVPDEYAKTLPADKSNDIIRSEIYLRSGRPILIYPNGNYENGLDLLIEGYWAWSEKISTMLPSDYSPK